MASPPPLRVPFRSLGPVSELEKALAFEAEFGMTAEVARRLLLQEIRTWHEKASRGLSVSTAAFQIIMRDAKIRRRGSPPDVILHRLQVALREASLDQLGVYERFRRSKRKASS